MSTPILLPTGLVKPSETSSAAVNVSINITDANIHLMHQLRNYVHNMCSGTRLYTVGKQILDVEQ